MEYQWLKLPAIILTMMTFNLASANQHSMPSEMTYFQVIGIYSECWNTSKEDLTSLNMHARKANRKISNVTDSLYNYRDIFNGYKLSDVVNKSQYVNFKNSDVCHNESKLLEIVEQIVLDPEYFYRNKTRSFSSPAVSLILTYLPTEMSELLSFIIHDIPILHLAFNETTLKREYELYTTHLIQLVQYLNRERVVLLFIRGSGNETLVTTEYYQASINAFKTEKYCMLYKSGNIENQKLEIWNLSERWFHENTTVIILFGRGENQLQFLTTKSIFLSTRNVTIITQDLTNERRAQLYGSNQIKKISKLILNTGDEVRAILNWNYIKELKPFLQDMEKEFEVGYIAWMVTFYLQYIFNTYGALLTQSPVLPSLHHSLKQQRDYVVSYFGAHNQIVRKRYTWLDYRDKNFLMSNYEYGERLDQQFVPMDLEPLESLKGGPTRCHNITCGPGFYKTYGNISNGYAWKCEPCSRNTIKLFQGNTICTPCTGMHEIPNQNQTACVDPYVKAPLEINTKERIFVDALCVLGIGSTLATMVVFTKKKDTPIVKTSDYKLSMVHMSLIIFIFGTELFSMLIVEANYGFCVAKLLFVSIAYLLNVGIMFIKSQKLLQAFLSKVRLTAEEIKKTIAMQIFTVFIILASINGGLLIAIHQHPIDILEIRDSTKLTKEYVCHTHFHFNVIIGLTMIVQLLCSIQAFRGRHLPSVMNDGIVLTYATFALSLVFTISFAIVHFRTEKEKEVFHFGAVALNNLIINFLIYGQKAVRILVYPAENTKEYFRTQRLLEMQRNAIRAIDFDKVVQETSTV